MEKLEKEDFELLQCCPWDGETSDTAELLYQDDLGCEVVRCLNCGIVYAKRRLNQNGLPKYWNDYLSRVHIHDIELVEKRKKMYQIDCDFSRQYVSSGKVLDIGCGNGSFMSVYEGYGYETFGVEYGKEAADVAEKHHNVRYGVFDEMDFDGDTFDLIVFRGVLQYVPNPKSYLKKAVGLLKHHESGSLGGCLFITAQPNMDSLGFRLFGKHFTQAVNGTNFIGYTEKALTSYISSLGMKKVGEKYFYLETPYADEIGDLSQMARALQYHREGKKIDFKSPAYWGNMMTLMYRA